MGETISLPGIPAWMAAEVAAYDLAFTRPPRTVLDLGANIGAFSMLARRRWPEAVIIAVEPMPDNTEAFAANVGTDPRVKLIPAAARSFTGEADIFIGDREVTSSFHQLGRQSASTLRVPCVDAAKLPPSEYIKLDTEGCEVEILQSLNLQCARAVAVEYHREEDILPIKALCDAAGMELVTEKALGDTWGILIFARPGALVKAGPVVIQEKLFIALPVYNSVEAGFCQSLLRLVADAPVNLMVRMCVGDSLVSRARNTLTADFLASDCSHLFFIDTDLIFKKEHVAQLAARTGEDIVGGLYPKKIEGPLQYVVNSHFEPRPVQANGLQEMRYVGTGFMKIHRRVFERMIEKYGDTISFTPDHNPGQKHYDFWSVGTYEYPDGKRRFLSEDWFFCQRAMDLGFKVWADTRIQLQHVGVAVYPLRSQQPEFFGGLNPADTSGPRVLAPANPEELLIPA